MSNKLSEAVIKRIEAEANAEYEDYDNIESYKIAATTEALRAKEGIEAAQNYIDAGYMAANEDELSDSWQKLEKALIAYKDKP